MSLFTPLSLTCVDFFLVPTTLTVATVCGHTAAGGTVAIRENGAGFSRRSTVRRMVTATLKHRVQAPVAGGKRSRNMKFKETMAKRVQVSRYWMLPVFAPLLSIKSRSRSQ